MVEETFVAPNPQEAFELAKKKYEHFSDLKLLRAIQIKNSKGELVSEITVQVPEHAYLESIGIDEEMELINEIEELKDKIAQMKSVIDPGEPMQLDTQLGHIKRLMVGKGLQQQWLDEMLDPFIGSSVAEDETMMLSFLVEEIEEAIRITKEQFNEKRIMLFVGATGVGKTTTIAKLAARCALLLERPLRVALVNLDTFRVGAYEQLEHYAQMMHLDHIRVDRVEEFDQTLSTLDSYDAIFVDTAGISPYDTDKLIQTIEFLKSVKEHTVETHLVLSATAKFDDILDVYEHFSFMDIHSAVLTKFDETKRIGELIAFLIEHQLPVSYVSSGQKVPEDLEPASKKMLLDRFVSELHA